MSKGRIARIIWGMSSQVFASATSLALTIFTARSLSAEEYGAFALAVTMAFFLQGLIRSLTSEVLVFRHSSAKGAERKQLTAACLSGSLGFALMGAACSLVAGVLSHSLMWVLLAAAILGLVLQDAVRFILMAHGRAKNATLIDILSFVLTVSLLTIATLLGTVNGFLIAWGAAAWIAATVGLFILRAKIGWRHGRRWLRIAWHESRFFATDFLLSNAVSTAAVFLVAVLLGSVAAGQIRAAAMLLLPILLLTRGIFLAVASEANRLSAENKHRSVARLGLVVSVVSVAATAIWIPIVAFVPLDVLQIFLGDSAAGAASAFPYVAVATAAIGLAAGPNIVLKAVGHVRKALLGKLISLPVSVVGVTLLAISFGVPGSQIGLALGEFACAVFCWYWVVGWLKNQAASSEALELGSDPQEESPVPPQIK